MAEEQNPINSAPIEALSAQQVEALVDSTPIIDEVDAAMEEIVKASDLPVDPQKPVEEAASRKAHKAFQEFNISAEEDLVTGDELTLPANYDKETRQVLTNLPNVDLLGSNEARTWAEAVSEGLGYSTVAETFIPTLEDETADFRQRLTHNNTSLAASVPKMRAIENENVKGERAIIRMITHLGLGTLYQVPLWHSGFWITFKPPTESEILELNRLLLSDKIKFGRQTYGLAFTNTVSYTIDRLLGFALSHVYDITVKAEDININNIREHISSQDIPSLLWGFVCTMYPRGFKYRRACVADPEKCNNILEETLNVFKLQWTNGAALSDWQRTHMSARQSKVKDLASVTRYKEELTRIQKTRVEINKGKSNAIAITIKTPSVREYVDAGHRWIGDIVATVDKALGADAEDGSRNKLVVKYGQASAMRQYSHWVDSIEYETNTITELETIEELLTTLSSDDEIRETFTQSVVDFINRSTVSVIGIPVYDCPVCNKTNEGYFKLPAYKNIIPLDMVQVFFGLLTQRLERIAER